MRGEAANVEEAGLDEWVELVDGNAFELVPTLAEAFDVVFIDAEKDDYEALFQLAREKVEPGAVFVADNVLSHEDTLGAYSRARQDDPTLVSVTVPLDRGLELTTVLSEPLLRTVSSPARLNVAALTLRAYRSFIKRQSGRIPRVLTP